MIIRFATLRSIAGALFLPLLLLTAACGRRASGLEKLNLPPAPLFAGNEMWGVVRDPYQRISSSPSREDTTVMTLRQGEIVSVLVIQSFEDIYWCRIKYENREGWTRRDNLDIYETLAKAENGAAQRLAPAEERGP